MKVKTQNTGYLIEGVIYSNDHTVELNDYKIIIRNRITQSEESFQCSFKKESNSKYRFESLINFTFMINEITKVPIEMIYDLYIQNTTNQKNHKVGNPSFFVKNFIKDLTIGSKEKILMVTPYFTFKKNNLAFSVNSINKDNYNYMKNVMRFSWFFRLLYSKKNIWIIGELDYKAQDNGMTLYNHIRKEHSNKNVYYVIRENSLDKKNLVDKKNVINFHSKKHILYMLIAKKIVTTHHPEYIFPSKLDKYKKKVNGTKIFITHGVFGVKNMYKNYGNYVNGFKIDHITANSDREKNIFINDLKYGKEQITVTGMPRLDTLFSDDIKPTKDILIMPTWRDWLLSTTDFTKSEFFIRFKELLLNKYMKEMVKKHKLSITLCLHPNFRQYTESFKIDNIKLVYQGEENVQELIKSHALMITDYSSVAFDFSFLKKPVIFYQFDLNRFTDISKSHIDIPKDLPGDCVENINEVINKVKYYVENDYKTMYNSQSNKLIKYYDRNSSERVYEACLSAKKSKKRILEKLLFKVIHLGIKKTISILKKK